MKYQSLEVLLLRGTEGKEAMPEFIIDGQPYFSGETNLPFRVKVIFRPDQDLLQQTEYVAVLLSIDGRNVGYSEILNIRGNVTTCIFDGIRKNDFQMHHMKFASTSIPEVTKQMSDSLLTRNCGKIDVALYRAHLAGKRNNLDKFVSEGLPPDHVFIGKDSKISNQPSIVTVVDKIDQSLRLSELKFDLSEPLPFLEANFKYHTTKILLILELEEKEKVRSQQASVRKKPRITTDTKLENSMHDLDLAKPQAK